MLFPPADLAAGVRDPALQKRAAVAGEVEADLDDFEKLQALVNEHFRDHPSGPVLDLYR